MRQQQIKARVWIRPKHIKETSNHRIYKSGLYAVDVESYVALSDLLGFDVTRDLIESRDFRDKYRIALASNHVDKYGETVYDRDIVNVGDTDFWENNHAMRLWGSDDVFRLQRAAESVTWSEGTAEKCRRVASYYEDPDLYSRLFTTHLI
ncbi:hypothetical protein GCM10027346_41490 [Hymenobacter seoulensis]